jgi:membrane protein required for beta-lactamase induction
LENKKEVVENSQQAAASLSEKITLATLVFKFIGILERVLPAFLVAWNNQLRQKNKQLELKLEQKQIEEKVEAKLKEIDGDAKSSKEVIDKFLSS